MRARIKPNSEHSVKRYLQSIYGNTTSVKRFQAAIDRGKDFYCTSEFDEVSRQTIITLEYEGLKPRLSPKDLDLIKEITKLESEYKLKVVDLVR
jgi:hypothetical protein